MPKTTTQVLDHRQVEDRIKRIAWQIYENHQEETEIVVAGIVDRGYLLAELLVKQLKAICPLQVSLHRIILDKDKPLEGPPRVEPQAESFNEKAVIVVDDVLNTGSTLMYGVRYFLDYKVKQIKTVVLVDRNHKSFPIKADFKGLSLSTNLMEHVEVNISASPFFVGVS